jgi:autotransporter-associated beta strand protein
MKNNCSRIKTCFGRTALLALPVFCLLMSAQLTQAAVNLTTGNFTGVIVPQYCGDNGPSGAATARLPYFFRATVSGLTASTSYRYYVQMALASDVGTAQSGAGNSMYISTDGSTFTYTTNPSLSSSGNYGTFTTDASGNYTGWFCTVPTGSTRWNPGTVYPAITISGGGSSSTVTYRFALDTSVTAMELGAGSGNSTAIYGNSSGTAKDFVLLYDNKAGTGRPLACADIEDDSTTIPNVAAFYSTSVNAVNGAWGTIIPNTLANGVLRIEQRNNANTIIGFNTDNDGTWPSGAATVNPATGTTAIAIAATDDTLNGPEPTTDSTSLGFNSVTSSQMGVSWTSGNGINRIVIAKAASAPTAIPQDGTAYTGNASYGSGSSLSDGSFVVYNGSGNSFTLTGLSPSTTYYLEIFEYDGSGSTVNYLTSGTPASGNQATSASSFSALSDIIRDATFSTPTSVLYNNYQTASGLTTGNSLEVARFTLRDGGASSPDSDSAGTKLTAIGFSLANFSNLRTVALFDSSSNKLGEVTAAATVSFTGLSLTVADNSTTNFFLTATFNSSVTDHAQYQFTVTSASADPSGSTFAAPDAGGASSDTAGSANTIVVTATKLAFSPAPPSSITVGGNFAITVQAQDANGNVDLDSTASVAISKLTGTGTVSGGSAQNLVSGTLTFYMNYNTLDTFSLQAAVTDASGLTSVSSGSITTQNVIVWSTGGGSSWVSTNNWTGNVVPSALNDAQFGVNPTGSATVGINLGGAVNNGLSNEIVGAVEVTTNRTSTLRIDNSSTTTNGTLTVNGTIVNGVTNVIIRNASTKSLTISDGSTEAMNLALGNTTENIIQLDGSGAIGISNIIMSAVGASGPTPLTIAGSGSGEVDITGTANTWVGNIKVTGGEVRFTADASLGDSGNTVTVDGGRFGIASGTTVDLSDRLIYLGATAGTSISAPGSAGVLTYNGVLANKPSSTGILVKQGAGTLSLGGLNTYSGGTFVNNGTVQLTTADNRLPTGTTVYLGQADNNNLGTLDLNGFNQTIAGLNSTTLTNSGSLSGKNTVTSSSASCTLTISGSTTNAFGNGMTNNSGVITGPINLVKSGSGTQILGDTNIYTGTTWIQNGTLLVNGVISASPLNISGGTLGGSGTIGGEVTNAAGGTLAPGVWTNTAGTLLTMGGDLTLLSGSTNIMKLSLDNSTNDMLVSGGTITYGGVLTVVTNGADVSKIFTNGQKFTLFITNGTSGGYTGSFTSSNLPPLSSGLAWSNSLAADGTIEVVSNAVVSPPAPVAGFSATPTNGFAPLQVAFVNTSTGSFTNSAWSFGDGNVATNTSGANVTNTYAAAGTYAVSLTVAGLGGSNLATSNNYIVVKPQTVLGKPVIVGGTNFIFSGTNGPAGASYSILTSTNVAHALASWTPLVTNNFNSDGTYNYTNSAPTNKAGFFRLKSPP